MPYLLDVFRSTLVINTGCHKVLSGSVPKCIDTWSFCCFPVQGIIYPYYLQISYWNTIVNHCSLLTYSIKAKPRTRSDSSKLSGTSARTLQMCGSVKVSWGSYRHGCPSRADPWEQEQNPQPSLLCADRSCTSTTLKKLAHWQGRLNAAKHVLFIKCKLWEFQEG